MRWYLVTGLALLMTMNMTVTSLTTPLSPEMGWRMKPQCFVECHKNLGCVGPSSKRKKEGNTSITDQPETSSEEPTYFGKRERGTSGGYSAELIRRKKRSAKPQTLAVKDRCLRGPSKTCATTDSNG